MERLWISGPAPKMGKAPMPPGPNPHYGPGIMGQNTHGPGTTWARASMG